LFVASVVSTLYSMQMDIGNVWNIQLVNIVKNLTVAAEAESIVPLPGGQLGGVVVAVAFSEPTILFSNAGETASLPALVHRLGDPVDPRVAANGLMIGVNEDDLVIFVDTVLVDPVRVQDSEVTTTPADALFRNTPQSSLGFEVVHTLMDGFTIGGTLRYMLLAVTPADPDTVDNVSLLGFISQPAGLVWARWARSPVDNLQLTILPASDAKEESEDIRLFLFVEFADVLVRAHSCGVLEIKVV